MEAGGPQLSHQGTSVIVIPLCEMIAALLRRGGRGSSSCSRSSFGCNPIHLGVRNGDLPRLGPLEESPECGLLGMMRS